MQGRRHFSEPKEPFGNSPGRTRFPPTLGGVGELGPADPSVAGGVAENSRV